MKYELALSDFSSRARRARELEMKDPGGLVIDKAEHFNDWFIFIAHWSGDDPQRANLLKWAFGVYQENNCVVGSDYYDAYHFGTLSTTFFTVDCVYKHARQWIAVFKKQQGKHDSYQLKLTF